MILGIGSPILDYVIPIDYSFFEKIEGSIGGMQVVSFEKFNDILKHASTSPKITAGGSCSNVIKALASLGFFCALFGVIGDDENGHHYQSFINNLNITNYFQTSHLPTSKALCLISPHGERTCRTYLGASQDIHIEKVKKEYFLNKQLVHIEGYSLLQGNLTEHAMKMAKSAGCLISFDLGSFEIVEQYKEKILYLLNNFVDIVFANQDETFALTGVKNQLGCEKLGSHSRIAVVMRGKDGCIVSNNKKLITMETEAVKPIDTTGAGDLFAAGFLASFLKSYSLEVCARFGNKMGKEAVMVLGANLTDDKYLQLKNELLKL